MKPKALVHICYVISGITAAMGVSEYWKILRLSYEMGKDDTDDFVWYFLLQGIQAWGIICSCIAFFILALQAAKGKIFTRGNELLLMIFGSIILALGSISYLFSHFFSKIENPGAASSLLLLVGLSFIFFSLIFKIGIGMQQDQDLTI